jgi:hypothetical protein
LFTRPVGALVPTATPPKTVAALHELIAAVTGYHGASPSREPEIIASTPGEFAAHIKAELARWAKVEGSRHQSRVKQPSG